MIKRVYPLALSHRPYPSSVPPSSQASRIFSLFFRAKITIIISYVFEGGKKNNFADQLDNPSLSLKTYLYFIFYHEMCFTLNYFFNECVNLELWNWWVRFGLFGGPCKLPERRRGDGAIAIQSCGLDCISHYPAPLSPKPLSFAPYQFSPFNNWSKTQQVDIEKACLEISTISHNRR